MLRTMLTSSALLMLGTASFAGNISEPVVVAPVAPVFVPAAPTQDWTGFYAGGQYINGTFEADDGVDNLETDVDGFGIHAGYLRDLGSFVVGGEFDYDVLDGDGDTDGSVDVMRLKGIAGYDLGSFMPYITAGVANVDGEGNSDTVGFYGLGGSYAINDRFRVGAEYLVHDTDDFDDTGIEVGIDTLSLRASFAF